MARTPRTPPEGWAYTPDGLRTLEKETDRFDSGLFQIWKTKRKIRGSRSLDRPDCRAASEFLLTGAPAPVWKIWVRVGSGLGIIVAGALIGQAFKEGETAVAVTLLLVGGAAMWALTALIQETILRK